MRDTTEGVDPLTAYQTALDVVSDAVMTGDLHTLRRMSRLPYPVRSLTGSHIVDTDEKLVANFEGFSRKVREMGVTHYVRVARHASFTGPDKIEGVHVTYFYRNGEEVLAPYENRMILVREYGLWRVAAADHAMLNDGWPVVTPVAGDRLPEGPIKTLMAPDDEDI
jgi:hypothetical protein